MLTVFLLCAAMATATSAAVPSRSSPESTYSMPEMLRSLSNCAGLKTLILGLAYTASTTTTYQTLGCTGCVFQPLATSMLTLPTAVETYTTATIIPYVTIFNNGSSTTSFSTITKTLPTSDLPGNPTSLAPQYYTHPSQLTWIVDDVTL